MTDTEVKMIKMERYMKNTKARDNSGDDWKTPDWFWGASPSARRAIKQAYLAGLKAGRPKWHKVADNDYPPCEKGGFTVNVFTDRGEIAYYNYDEECWVAEPASVEIDSPVAWCEIPKYKE